jgi:methylsterol monooxygenase
MILSFAVPSFVLIFSLDQILSFTHGMHLFTLYSWLAVRLMQTIEVHSGYNFPFSFNHWVPFWGGAEFHDFHHMTFSSNYASTFTIWDNVFGTAKPFYQWRDKEQAVSSKKSQ